MEVDMKKTTLLLIFLTAILAALPALAQEPYPPSAPPAQGFSPMQPQFPWPGAGYSMGYGRFGNQGHGPGMGYGFGWQGGRNYAQPDDPRGFYKSGPGMMMGQGMTQFGMGPGMIRGIGVMGYIPSEAFQKFFDDTREMRKQLNGLMFDYAELLRKPKQDPAERITLENEIMALRQKVYDKAPRYQWPFE